MGPRQDRSAQVKTPYLSPWRRDQASREPLLRRNRLRALWHRTLWYRHEAEIVAGCVTGAVLTVLLTAPAEQWPGVFLVGLTGAAVYFVAYVIVWGRK